MKPGVHKGMVKHTVFKNRFDNVESICLGHD